MGCIAPIQERFASMPHSRSVSTPNPNELYELVPPLRPSTPPAQHSVLSPPFQPPPPPLRTAPPLFPVSPQSTVPATVSPTPVRTLEEPVFTLFHIESTDEPDHAYTVRYLNGTTELFGLKIFVKTEGDSAQRRSFVEDGAEICSLDHPNIVKTSSLLEDQVYLALVTEHAKGIPILDKLLTQACTSELFLPRLLSQLFSALCYAHSHGTAHNRISMDELLLFDDTNSEKWTLKLSNWEKSRKFANFPLLKSNPSVFFAPEVYFDRGTTKSDVWSCGVIIYSLIFGQLPFSNHAYSRTFLDLTAIPVVFPLKPPNLPEETTKMIKSMLDWNGENRPSVEKLMEIDWKGVEIAVGKLAEGDVCKIMKKAVKEFVIENLTEKSELAQLVRLFTAIDANGDNLLTADHFALGLSKIMPVSLAKPESEKIIQLCGINGFANYKDFLVSAYSEKRLLSQDNLYSAFRLLDVSDEGRLKRSDLIALFVGLKEGEKKKLWRNLCRAMDRAGVQELGFREFVTLLMRQFT